MFQIFLSCSRTFGAAWPWPRERAKTAPLFVSDLLGLEPVSIIRWTNHRHHHRGGSDSVSHLPPGTTRDLQMHARWRTYECLSVKLIRRHRAIYY